jgi:hypothetical protein
LISDKEIKIRIADSVEKLLKMAEESIQTLNEQTEEMKKTDKYVIPPPEDIIKITTILKNVNELRKDLHG